MFVTRLIYASKVSKGVVSEDLNQIIEKASVNNKVLGVTGILVFSDKYFLQSLEGGREEVNQIYHKIMNDKRHFDPQIISYRDVSHRIFEEWNMKLFLESKINKKVNLRYSSKETFDPYDMQSDSATEFMEEIGAQIRAENGNK